MPAQLETTWARYITLKEGAAYLSVTEQSLRRYIAVGRIPAYRLGKRALRVDREDLDSLLERVPTAAVGAVEQ